MELRDRKRIKNGALTGFADGDMPEYLTGGRTWYNTDYVQPTAPQSDFRGYIPQWQATPQFYGNSAKSLYDPTNLSTEPPTTKDLGIPSGQTYTQLAATPDQKEMITGDTSKGHNFDNGLQSMKTAGKPISYDKVGGALLATMGAVGDVVDAHQYNKSTSQLLSEAGTRGANAAGIGYTWQNDPEYQRELEEVRKSNTANTLKATGSGAAAGAAIGSVIPGLGTLAGGAIGGVVGAIGGLFGGASRKRRAEEKLRQAEINAKVRNDFNRDDALTQAIRERNAQEIGNPFANAYRYADGKPVFSSEGPIGRKENSRVSSGELIVNFDKGTVFQVPGRPNNKDDKYAWLEAEDGVIPNKHGLAAYAKATGDYVGAMKMTDMFLRQKGNNYKCGKLPKHGDGISPWTNIIPSAFGGLAGIYQYFDAKNQNIKTPNIYASNPYEQDAFAALNELKNNPYPTLWQLRDAEARTRNALDSSGGLGAGQKMLARIAQQGVTQSQWAKALADTQAYNNAQRAALANAKLTAGNQDATRTQAANQFNEEYVAKAHAARQQGMQMGLYNFMQALQNYYANEFKRKQFGETLGLYKQQQALDLDKYYAYLNNK